MPIELVCGACGKDLKVKDELAGKKVKCPGCDVVIRIPDPAAAPAASPSPAAGGHRAPGRRVPPRRAPGRRRREEEPQEELAEGEERPRFQRRKKAVPDWVWIPLLLLVVVAIAYPLVQWRREEGTLKRAEGDLQEARQRLAAGEGETAANIMKATVMNLRSIETDDATMFRYLSFWAQALLESPIPDREAANVVLRECASYARNDSDDARLALLRARAHEDQTDYPKVTAFYMTALDKAPDREVAEEALLYMQNIVDAEAKQVIGKHHEINTAVDLAENHPHPTGREANQRKIPLLRGEMEDALLELELAGQEAAKLLQVTRKVDPTTTATVEARINRVQQEAIKGPGGE